MDLLCKTCGEEILANWDICPNCLGPIIQTKICSSCNSEIKGTWKICPSCKTPTGNTATADYTPKRTITTGRETYISPSNNSLISVQNGNYVELALNDLVADRYVVKKKIGEGGFGRVYEVYDQLTEKILALKTLPYTTKESINNILLEFESRDRINNTEHIIKAYQPQLTIYKEQNIIIYPLEIAEKNMRDWLTESKKYFETRLDEGLEIFKQACLGVEAIHEAELIHLDLKPENILLIQNKKAKDLSQKWIVKISDFGLARGSGMENLEILKDGIGTPAYMSPEQIMAARWKDVGKEADIYSLGMILYELIDGELPYSGSARMIKEKKLNPQIQITPLQSNKDVAQIAMKCLERDKTKRIKNISELIYAVDEKRRLLEELKINKKKAEEFLQEIKRLFDLKKYSDAKLICRQADEWDKSQKQIVKWKNIHDKIERIRILDEERKKKGEMILVQGGSFNMGSNEYPDESPIHLVKINNFLIDKFPVTVKQYREFCKATKRSLPKAPHWGWYEDHPIVNVTWKDATEYADWCGKRLPTEAEWEYAARGGNKSSNFKYSGSDNINEVAWYLGNSGGHTNPVGSKLPNELGIYDLSGNVKEWCSDWYSSYHNSSIKKTNDSSVGSFKILRGGSWNLNESGCRNTLRNSYDPELCDDHFGFRCVKDIASKKPDDI